MIFVDNGQETMAKKQFININKYVPPSLALLNVCRLI